MKSRIILLGTAGVIFAGACLTAQAETRRFTSKPGDLKVRIEGTSNVHDWQVESKIIGGYVEAGENFPTEPGKEVKLGKLDAKVEAFIPVTSLRSLEKDGTPYSTKMDDIMYEKFKPSEFPRAVFTLDELVLKEAPKGKDQPYVCDATGQLAVAGVTNKITMVANILPQPEGKLRITGTVPLKMTSFKIDPPAPKIAMGLIKTGDDVKLMINWLVVEKKK